MALPLSHLLALAIVALLSTPLVLAHTDLADHTDAPIVGEGIDAPMGDPSLDPGILGVEFLAVNDTIVVPLGVGEVGEELELIARLRCGCNLHLMELRLLAPDGSVIEEGWIAAPALFWNTTITALPQVGEYSLSWTNLGVTSAFYAHGVRFGEKPGGGFLPAAGFAANLGILVLVAAVGLLVWRRGRV